MRVKANINRNKKYQKANDEIKKRLRRVIVYGVNAVRNTALDGVLRGAKTWVFHCFKKLSKPSKTLKQVFFEVEAPFLIEDERF